MHATADNIDAQNPGYEGLLGAGRVNAVAALTAGPPPPPRVLRTSLPSNGTAGQIEGGFTLGFDRILDPAGVNEEAAFALTFAGSDAVLGTPDDEPVPLVRDEYMLACNDILFIPPDAMGGRYRFRLDASLLQDPFGTSLDGDGDGTPGDPWESTIVVCRENIPTGCSGCAGDMDGSATRDGRDIQLFVDCVLGGDPALPGCACADSHIDGVIDDSDARALADILLGRRLGLPLYEDFPTHVFNLNHWDVIDGATIDYVGIEEPSEPHSLRLNSDPSGTNSVTTLPSDLTGETEVRLVYYYEQTGDGDSPDQWDEL